MNYFETCHRVHVDTHLLHNCAYGVIEEKVLTRSSSLIHLQMSVQIQCYLSKSLPLLFCLFFSKRSRVTSFLHQPRITLLVFFYFKPFPNINPFQQTVNAISFVILLKVLCFTEDKYFYCKQHSTYLLEVQYLSHSYYFLQ